MSLPPPTPTPPPLLCHNPPTMPGKLARHLQDTMLTASPRGGPSLTR